MNKEIPTDDKMPAEQWDRFKKHRDEFKQEFIDEDEDSINCALQDLPGNIRGEGEEETQSYKFDWDGCSLHVTACYYAQQEVGNDPGVAICSIIELKELISKL